MRNLSYLMRGFQFFIIAFFFFNAKAQTQEKWKFDRTVNHVDLFYTVAECNGSSTVFLKFINHNPGQVSVSWDESFFTKESSDNIEGRDGRKQIILKQGQTKETDCGSPKYKALVVRSQDVSPTHKTTVIRYKFQNVSVKKVK